MTECIKYASCCANTPNKRSNSETLLAKDKYDLKPSEMIFEISSLIQQERHLQGPSKQRMGPQTKHTYMMENQNIDY